MSYLIGDVTKRPQPAPYSQPQSQEDVVIRLKRLEKAFFLLENDEERDHDKIFDNKLSIVKVNDKIGRLKEKVSTDRAITICAIVFLAILLFVLTMKVFNFF